MEKSYEDGFIEGEESGKNKAKALVTELIREELETTLENKFQGILSRGNYNEVDVQDITENILNKLSNIGVTNESN